MLRFVMPRAFVSSLWPRRRDLVRLNERSPKPEHQQFAQGNEEVASFLVLKTITDSKRILHTRSSSAVRGSSKKFLCKS